MLENPLSLFSFTFTALNFFSPLSYKNQRCLFVAYNAFLVSLRKKEKRYSSAAPNRKRVSFIFLRFPSVIGKRGKRKLVYRGRGFRLSALLPAFHGGIPRARLGAPFFVGGRDLLFTAVQGMRHNFLGRKSAFERGRRQERAGRLELSSP